MYNIRNYWKKVRAAMEMLPPGNDFYLVSVENDDTNTIAGQIVECSRERTARNLAEGSHRLATEEEIAAYRERQAELAREIKAKDLERRQPIVVTLAPGMMVTATDRPAAPARK